MPLTWHAFQDLHAAVFECDAGAGHQVLDRSRNENFAAVRERSDARSVESTISASITVASTRSGSGPRRTPVTNSSTSSRSGSAFAATGA
ncbi:MAG: hypothetical protein WCA09_05620 [Burkholderiales bacterium]